MSHIFVGLVVFAFHFQWNIIKNDFNTFAGACNKQACSLMSGEYDLWADPSVAPQYFF